MKIRLPLMFAFFLATHWLVLSQPDGQIDRYLNQYPEADRNGDGMLTRDEAKTHRQNPCEPQQRNTREQSYPPIE